MQARNIRKTMCQSLVAFAVFLFVGWLSLMAFSPSAYASVYAENDNLTDEQISERFKEINSTYSIGEVFNECNTEFIMLYASKPNTSSIAPLDSQGFNVTGSGYGTSVRCTGSLYHNGTVPSYNYGGNINVAKTSGPTPRKMTLTVHCTSYGIVGSGGAVKIYDDGVSASTSYSNSFYASPARSYSGYMLWYNVSAWLDVTTSEGNFFTVS